MRPGWSEIVDHTNRLRGIQLEALTSAAEKRADGSDVIPPAAVLFLLSGIPKMVRMEEDFEVFVGHDEISKLVNRYIEALEPSAPSEHRAVQQLRARAGSAARSP